jgi:acylphosphatase
MRTLHITVRGLVQGVGYRFYAQRQASALGIAGTVRNLPNGDVEVVAQGPDSAVAAFLEALRRGPLGSHVEEVATREMPDAALLSGFHIRA